MKKHGNKCPAPAGAVLSGVWHIKFVPKEMTTANHGKLLLLAVSLIVTQAAQDAMAIIRRPDREDAQYIALAEHFPAVCLVCRDGAAFGSATLIAPRWVLTAGHAVDRWFLTARRKWEEDLAPHKWTVLFGNHEYRVTRIVEYPGFSCKDGGVDLALLELDRSVDRIAPIPIYVGRSELGRMTTLVGFGCTGTFETGPPVDAAARAFMEIPARRRVKRAGTNLIVRVLDDGVVTRIDSLDSATNLEASIAGGDSGGPALIEGEGRMYIAGVLTSPHWGTPPKNPPAMYGDHNQFVRVSTYARWIEDTIGEDFGATRLERLAAIIGLGLLAVLAGCTWFVRRHFPSISLVSVGCRLLLWIVTLSWAAAIIAFAHAALQNQSSPAVPAFILMAMISAAIVLRYAGGSLGARTGKAARRVAGWFAATLGATVAGLSAVCACQPVKVVESFHYLLPALVVGFLIASAIELIALVVTRLTELNIRRNRHS